MTPESLYLQSLARRYSAGYTSHPKCRAAMLSGSAAEGLSDRYSDVDVMLYYSELPSDSELDAAREANGGASRLWLLGDRAAGAMMESYLIYGVECQFAHTTIEAWEAQMAEILVNHAVDSPLQKALSGTLHGICIYGDTLISGWKALAAAYPEALRLKMAEHNLSFFPVWHMGERFFGRDADLWFHQIRVETIQQLLGVLAGINRVYFTTFQFKHTSAFISKLAVAPENLAARIGALLLEEPVAAANALGMLVAETVALVERELPAADTSAVRAQLARRFPAWEMKVSQDVIS